ncbi:MAG: LCP family protein [Clostridia bacterium]|nr:LCP family protein [Clostridia bacterium]
MDDIYSSSKNKKKHDSKKAFEDLFSDTIPKDSDTTETNPHANPRFTDYEDISSGRDDIIETFPTFEEEARRRQDLRFGDRKPLKEFEFYEEDYDDEEEDYYEDEYEDDDDDEEELTSPFVHGDEPQYQPPVRENREYEDFDTKRRSDDEEIFRPKKKKTGRGIWVALISFLLVVAILVGLATSYAISLVSKLNHDDSIAHENPYVSSSELMSDSDVRNILLLGVDKADGGVSRSDTNMLVSINKKTNEIKLVSFMRDYWVEIPENGSAKLNAACVYGGPELTVYTIEKNFGIKIDGFAMVDFEVFISIIDALGGIEVEITEEEARFMRNQVTWTEVQSGENVHINGREALLYCRIRKLDSDFMRTSRQRKVISAIINKMKGPDAVKLLTEFDTILPKITTNIPSTQLLVTAVSSLGALGNVTQQTQVPFENTWSYDTISGQSVIVADNERQGQMLKEYLYK